jgi:hypothetical protein
MLINRRSCFLRYSTFSALFAVALSIPCSVQAQTYAQTYVQTYSDIRYPYPEPIVDGFVSECSQEASELPAPMKHRLCLCLVNEFQTQYNFATFQAIGKQVQVGQSMPQEMAALITKCVEQVMLKPT